jgi:phenylpropionate dioxygenase-like ring-hydroxylating dioxygenase large terminal subunit
MSSIVFIIFNNIVSINIYMFISCPRIFAHRTAINNQNYVVPEYILNKGQNEVNLFHRYCPHRMYPLASPGTHIDEIHCKFHNFKWSREGIPLNNTKKLSCGQAEVGKSGLIFKDFTEPNHKWVDDLAGEQHLAYSHSLQGESKGSWLWLMDAEADYLHVDAGFIHPRLSSQINSFESIMDEGDGWIYQEHTPGWWSVYIYPYTFIEHKIGCLSVNYITPNDKNTEFGFTWITQFYYDPQISSEVRAEFETLETVFKEDVAAAELQKGKYFPLMQAINRYENHCVHFGKWFKVNRLSDPC